MTDEIKKVVAEGVEDESVTQDENLESADEVVEEEVEVTEAKVKEEEEDEKDSDEDDEEEVEESADEDESDEEDEEEVEEVSIPKTKAGVINAALDMLKKARKDEAQQLFAKMVKQVSESEDEGGSHTAPIPAANFAPKTPAQKPVFPGGFTASATTAICFSSTCAITTG